MATLTPGVFTYSEWGLRRDATGGLSTLVNLLSQNNGMMNDMLAVECQNGNAFEFTQVVKLPAPQQRAYNQGISPSIAGVGKQIQICANYEDLIILDKDLAELGGNLAGLRTQETQLHMQGFSQGIASKMWYGNAGTNPLDFTGFANLYNTVTVATSEIANNVIDCGGTGSTNTSLWLVGWGPRQIHTIFPQGMPTGLQLEDAGVQNTYDSDGKVFRAYQSWLRWKLGLAIHDWRYAVRACNIDVTLFGDSTAADLIAILTALVYKPPVMPAGVMPVQTADDPGVTMPTRFAFYANRTLMQALDLQAQEKPNAHFTIKQWGGEPCLTFREIPIRCSDALLNTESRVL